MSWLSKLLPPQINQAEKSNVPEGLWDKCQKCREIIYHANLVANLNVCHKCQHHHYLPARARLLSILDEGCVELAADIKAADILKFVDSKPYTARLLAAQHKTGETEALIVMQGKISGHLAVAAAFEFNFIGGSMGAAVGERFVQGVKAAVATNSAFVCIASSGGARMQEGLTSLLQMAKTAAALHLLSQQRLPFISVLANPTMGGVSASFASLGDIIIAEPAALIGFAGPRVIQQTIRETLPAKFQTAEFLLEHGAVDMVVHRMQLKSTLASILAVL